jgi:protein-tyrosine phosphatase
LVIDVLLVCTGNICRSPMAEAILRRHLAAHGVEARVTSAGTMNWARPPTDEAIAVMNEHGLDIIAHRSRPLSAATVADADLILGMTRTHVDVAATQGGDGVAARTFLVGEAARLAERVGPRQDGESVASWVQRLDAARDTRHGRAVDEIADPVGESIDFYRVTATTLDRHLQALAPLLAGRARSIRSEPSGGP